jgi:hypothetical protein
MYFFNISTGIRYKDTVNIPNVQGGGYDPDTNNFWFYNEGHNQPILKSFTIDGFSHKGELGDNSSKNFPQFVKNRTVETVEKQKSERKTAPRNLEKFLKRLGNKQEEIKDQPETPQNQNSHYSRYLIMYTLHKGCDEMDAVLSKMDSLLPDLQTERLQCQAALFRSKYAVSISSVFIKELVKALERFSTFTEEKMTDENLLQQYEFLWLISLVHRFVISLGRLNLSTADLTDNEGLRKRLNELIPQLTSTLAEHGINNDKLKGDLHR